MQELLRVLMGEELREALPQLQHNLTEDKLVRLIEAGQVHPARAQLPLRPVVALRNRHMAVPGGAHCKICVGAARCRPRERPLVCVGRR